MTADRTCEVCRAGTFSADAHAPCAPVTRCTVDEWESEPPTTSSDRGCSTHLPKCPDGQFTSAAPTNFSDRVCRAFSSCPAGKYVAVSGTSDNDRQCNSCQSGHYNYQDNQDTCSACPAGQFRTDAPASSVVNVACRACPGGKYQGNSGQMRCDDCAAGTFYDDTDRDSRPTQCYRCPSGKFSAGDGASVCQACDTGQFAENDGATACGLCPRGKFQGARSANACESCAVGRFQAYEGSAECSACPDHTYFLHATVKDSMASECGLCPAGFVVDRRPNERRALNAAHNASTVTCHAACLESLCQLVDDVDVSSCIDTCNLICEGGGDDYHVQTTALVPPSTTVAPGNYGDAYDGGGVPAGDGGMAYTTPQETLVFTLKLSNETVQSFMPKKGALHRAIANTVGVDYSAIKLEVHAIDKRRLSSGGISIVVTLQDDFMSVVKATAANKITILWLKV